MKVRIALGKLPWNDSSKGNPQYLVQWHARLMTQFLHYLPRLLTGEETGISGYQTFELTVPAGDSEFDNLIKQFDLELKASNTGIGGMWTAIPTPAEATRARFIEILFFGGDADEDSRYRALNPPKRVLCEACRFPDITSVPEPFLVSKIVLKKQEVFRSRTGMLVVKARVFKLLQAAIGNQIETGEAVLAKSKEKLGGDNRVYWIRPKTMLRERSVRLIPKRCQTCDRTLQSHATSDATHVNAHGTGLSLGYPEVESFGNSKADFVVLDKFYGQVFENGAASWHWPMLMSGALVAYLKANKVTGIAASTSQLDPRCYFSAAGEPAFEPEVRTFGMVHGGAEVERKVTVRIEAGCKAVAALKNVPWDCDKDGYVYLHLTTPEVMVLDPMTWEEDSDGPYRVPKFKKPGLYRLPVKAIKDAEGKKRGVAVDSATLLFIDNSFFSELQDHYDWDKATKSDGNIDPKYHNEIAAKIGSRFGVCSAPSAKFKSEFAGDGLYTIDAKKIEACPV